MRSRGVNSEGSSVEKTYRTDTRSYGAGTVIRAT